MHQIKKSSKVPWPIQKAIVFGGRFPRIASRIGALKGLAALGKIIARRSGTFSVHYPGGTHPLRLRANSADIEAYFKVFVEEEYEFDIGFEPRTILDVGSHVGCSVAYFAARWPQAQILAVEPIRENLSLLHANVGDIPGVRILESALWGESGILCFHNPEGRTDSYMAQVANETTDGVQAVTMAQLLLQTPEDHFDLVKLDIEGAERELFINNSAWIERIGCLLVELHDRMIPGCEDALNRALKPFYYERSQRGENTMIRRLHRKMGCDNPSYNGFQ